MTAECPGGTPSLRERGISAVQDRKIEAVRLNESPGARRVDVTIHAQEGDVGACRVGPETVHDAGDRLGIRVGGSEDVQKAATLAEKLRARVVAVHGSTRETR